MAMRSPTRASARPVSPPPHGFSRGWLGSNSVTDAPRRASRAAAVAPAGPPPMMAIFMDLTAPSLPLWTGWHPCAHSPKVKAVIDYSVMPHPLVLALYPDV